jgi:hypothetical protein
MVNQITQWEGDEHSPVLVLQCGRPRQQSAKRVRGTATAAMGWKGIEW